MKVRLECSAAHRTNPMTRRLAGRALALIAATLLVGPAAAQVSPAGTGAPTEPSRAATVYWTSVSSGNWTDPANWSTGAVPGADDVVSINVPGTIVTVTSTTNVIIAGLESAEHLRITAGAFEVRGDAEIGGTLTVSSGILRGRGAGVELRVPAVSLLDNGRFEAFEGARLSLLNVTTYTDTLCSNGCDIVMWRASGEGSVIESPTLASIDGSISGFGTGVHQLLADAGGRIVLPALQTVAISTGGGERFRIRAVTGGAFEAPALQQISGGTVDVIAEDFLSRVEMPSLTSYSAGGGSLLQPKNAGTIDTASLASVNGLTLTWDGTGSMDTSVLTSFTNGTIDVSGAPIPLPVLSVAEGTRFLLDGVDQVIDGVSSFDRGRISVSGGATVTVPLLTSYNPSGLGGADLFLADGAGSTISLPALAFAGPSNSSGNIVHRIWARTGGQILMPALQAADGGLGFDRLEFRAESGGFIDLSALLLVQERVDFIASGAGSLIDVSAVATLELTSGTISVTGGATILSSSLFSVGGVVFTWDGSGTMDVTNVVAYQNGALNISGSAPDFANLQLLNGTDITVDGVTPSFPAVVSFNDGTLVVTNGAKVSLPGVLSYSSTGLGGVTLFEASGPGSEISMPQTMSLNCAFSASGSASQRIQATGFGAVAFPAVQSVAGATGGGDVLLVRTESGGTVDFDDLASAGDGIRFESDGFGSQTLVPSLVSISDVQAKSGLTATNGGSLSSGSLAALDGVHLLKDGLGSIDTSLLTSHLNGSIDVVLPPPDLSGLVTLDGTLVTTDGAVLALNAVTSFDRGRVVASAGGQVSLPGLVGYDGTGLAAGDVFLADGFGSSVALANVTTLEVPLNAGGTATATLGAINGGTLDLGSVVTIVGASGASDQLQVLATAGGTVDLASQTTVSTGVVGYVADGFGSMIDATPLVTYDAQDVTFTETNGGTILHQ